MEFGLCGAFEQLEIAEKTGFDYLELKVTEIAGWSEEEFEANRQKLRRSKISVGCFNVLFPGDMVLLGAQADENRRVQYLHRAFARLEKLEGSIVVFGSGRARTKPREMSFFSAYRELVGVTKQLGGIAGQYGLTIVIEPLNRKECDLINSMAEGALLVADTDLENVRLLTDFYHVATDGEPLSDLTRIGGFSHAHIASKAGRRYPLPEQPDNYAEFFRRLKETGYTGRVSIEGSTEDIAADGVRSLAYLKKLWENADFAG